MKRGYRLNSSASFSRYAQSRTANFYMGQGIVNAGLGRIDDGIKWAGNKLSGAGLKQGLKLDELGKAGGVRSSIADATMNAGQSVVDNASRIRKGAGIAAGVGAIGLGGAALANRGQPRQPGMY